MSRLDKIYNITFLILSLFLFLIFTKIIVISNDIISGTLGIWFALFVIRTIKEVNTTLMEKIK
jgi:hypothetical protein